MNQPKQPNKPYHLMTEAERRADRIAKNKVIDAHVAEAHKKLAVLPSGGWKSCLNWSKNSHRMR